MTCTWRGFLITLGGFLGAAPVQAGLYNTAEMQEWKMGPTPAQYQATVTMLQSLASPKVENDSPMRRRYFLIADLAFRPPASLTHEEKLNLSDYLIRRGQPLEAKSLLLPTSRDPGDHFWVLCNLAVACQLLGELDNAVLYQSQALKLWPENFHDLSEQQQRAFQNLGLEPAFGFLRKAETFHLKLLRSRYRESIRAKGKPFTTVDPLFDDGKDPPTPVRFMSEKGTFRIGKIEPKDKDKLPPDALDIVKQLVLWLPHDSRLLWQLAELYNIQGSIEDLDDLRKQLEGPNLKPADRKKHLQKFEDIHGSLTAAKTLFTSLTAYPINLRLPDVVEAFNAYNTAELPELEPKHFGSGDIRTKLDDMGQDEGGGVNWRTVAVSFATGLIAGVFILWQIQESRRRRRPTP